MFKNILAATFLLGLAGTAAIAADAKISDPQIAHIAYTAGQIDVTAAEQALKKSKNTDVIEFGALDGSAFDKAYIDNEVAYHKAVNSALADQLIPSAKNAKLKSLLETGLALFKEHQMHAEHLAAMMK
jgi:putative membrane protein